MAKPLDQRELGPPVHRSHKRATRARVTSVTRIVPERYT
jgi:hypothetical protein